MPRDSGVYVPIQLGYEPKFGDEHLLGHYVIGFGYDSSRFNSFSTALPASAGIPASTRYGNTPVLGAGRPNVGTQRQGRPGRRHRARRGFVANTRTIHPTRSNTTPALLDRAFWRARPEDSIAFLFSYFAMSGPLGETQAQELELGLPDQQCRHRRRPTR